MGKKSIIFLKTIIRGIIEVIYPKSNYCKGCGKADIQGLCGECMQKIKPCKDDKLCIGYYGHVLKKLILDFKYKKDFESAEILVELILDKIGDGSEYKDYIFTFIPISKNTLKKRGFNQCEYIANEIAMNLNMKVINTLEKVKETKVQKTLLREERLRNIKGAFRVIDKSKVEGKKLILIDDVITTGATISEGEKVLLESGAKEIKILTLAKSHI